MLLPCTLIHVPMQALPEEVVGIFLCGVLT
jgi:hypothetical protein